MKSKVKKQILKMLSQNLSLFRPELTDSFLCPTCMKTFSINDLGKISEAHIVPKAAGGQLKTFICKDCNSKFGSKQDKWFGDIINIANSPNASILSTAIKEKYFEIDGIRYNGSWKQESEGKYTFTIHLNRNPPDTKKLLDERFLKKPPKMRLSIPLPILKNQRLIDIGYLTAAYLMWFGLMGYSWALQDHLGFVRRQILNPDKEIITSKFLLTVKSANWEPWIGLITILGETYPAFGLKKHMVILPPRDRPNIYEAIESFDTDVNLENIKPFKPYSKPKYGPPISIIYENRLIVYAKPSEHAEKSAITFYYTKDSNKGLLLTPTEKEKFEELRKRDDAKYIRIDPMKNR